MEDKVTVAERRIGSNARDEQGVRGVRDGRVLVRGGFAVGESGGVTRCIRGHR